MRRDVAVSRRGLPRLGRILEYFREVLAELKKVVWPTRTETRRLTLMVLAISGAVGIILGVIDMGFTYLISLFW